jgi:hypothetical protein
MAEREAVEATVTGNDQQVGFRAVVMKQAIEYNLANDASAPLHKSGLNVTRYFTIFSRE